MSQYHTRSSCSSSEPGRERCSAFTLVELLVVIGIIALLLSILLPVLGRAKEAANSAKCLSNMKQVGMAVMMYAGDYQGRWLPPYKAIDRTPNYAPSGSPSWSGPFFFTYLSGKYLKENPQPWICPSDRYIDTRPYLLRLYSNVRDSNSSYMMNRDAPNYVNGVPPREPMVPAPYDHYYFNPRPLKYVKRPSQLIVFSEGSVVNGNSAYLASYRSIEASFRYDHRKNTSMTIGFADGRADQLPKSEVMLRAGEVTHGPTRIREYWYGSPEYTGIKQLTW